ncbi:unnamed protein product [Symbiodinium natans]|uniref:Uncharacterized protein n=1 Tax=Symbiodinium natans TaxID=878477 RepID=A0A812UYY6_9DINO|nr:unnamed protein product [Symbiodinium natans]
MLSPRPLSPSPYDPVPNDSLCSEDFLLNPDSSPGKLKYVGNGRGAFAKVDDVKFVGEGRGDYDVVQEASWWRRCLCWITCACLLIALLIAAIIVSRSYQHALADVVPRYSCYTSDGSLPPPNAHMIQTWSVPHRIWCCDNVGVGCEPATSVTTTLMPTTWIMVPVPDFNPGFLAPHGPGGPPVVPFAMQFHCHVGIPASWSPEQLAFCCERTQIGCPTPAPATVPPEPDCVVSAGNNPVAWPPSKREWCCVQHQTGCVQEAQTVLPTALPVAAELYDCTEGYANWPEWPSDKQSWCCEHHSRACPSAAEQAYDCCLAALN